MDAMGMTAKRQKGKTASGAGTGLPSPADRSRQFYRTIWRNWFLLAAMLVFLTIALAVAIQTRVGDQVVSPWPWVKTDRVLLGALALVVVAFIAHLTHQQRNVIAIHRELMALREESERRLQQHTARILALSNISHMISVETDLQNIFDSVTRMCVETFSCSRASLMLYDAAGNDLAVRSVSGSSVAGILNARQRVGEGIAGYVAERREPILLCGRGDSARYPGLELKDPSLASAMVVPIIVRDELVGVLNVSSGSREIVYDENDLLALQSFSSTVGACIRHTEQVNWMRRMVPQLGGAARPGRVCL